VQGLGLVQKHSHRPATPRHCPTAIDNLNSSRPSPCRAVCPAHPDPCALGFYALGANAALDSPGPAPAPWPHPCRLGPMPAPRQLCSGGPLGWRGWLAVVLYLLRGRPGDQAGLSPQAASRVPGKSPRRPRGPGRTFWGSGGDRRWPLACSHYTAPAATGALAVCWGFSASFGRKLA